MCDDQGFGESLRCGKYEVREAMAEHSGNAGNSCIHITDDQRKVMCASYSSSSTDSDSEPELSRNASYAFMCARCLLHPDSLQYIDTTSRQLNHHAQLALPENRAQNDCYVEWLNDLDIEDSIQVDYKWEFTRAPWNSTGCKPGGNSDATTMVEEALEHGTRWEDLGPELKIAVRLQYNKSSWKRQIEGTRAF